MTFLVLLALGVLMAVIYLPLRVYLTLTARSRRLKLLQRIREAPDFFRGAYDTDGKLRGFICGTLTSSKELTDESMSTHEPRRELETGGRGPLPGGDESRMV